MRNSTLLPKSFLTILLTILVCFGMQEAKAFDVKFVRVHAAQVSNNVVVRWLTDSEYNNEFFTVQRSINGGMEWKDLGIVPGSGATPGAGNYSFWDQNPVTGNVIYRVRQTDTDGTYTYSSKVELVVTPFAAEQQEELLVYPNPSDSFINIEGEVSMAKLTDITGKEVPTYLDNNGYTLRLTPMNKLSGMYFLILEKDGNAHVQKIKFN